jgi:hypothetical protein
MDMSNNWHLQWDMDGFQWEVLAAYMYEYYPVQGNPGHINTWINCLKFAYDHLLTECGPTKFLTIYTNDDQKFVIDRQTIIDVLKKEYPEEFI